MPIQPRPRAETVKPLRPSWRVIILSSCKKSSAKFRCRNESVDFFSRRLDRLNRSSRGDQSLLQFLQRRNPAHAGVDSIHPVCVKRDRKQIFEVKHDQAINNVESHTRHECPLLALAAEMPEEHEHSGHEPIDYEVECNPGLARLVGKGINKFGNSQAKNEPDMRAAHRQN